ncbi:hypothetical protein FB45DRAFT_1017272 [Roridomyces roridus]|uniref:Uncharacterized protein n=1 Tax=Roridomyces roridus TaxID=1738132 RepID=A0AAD7CI91_9AGAR|nr:hypothetical protein FB45DRAFT_1017272 [Roridomyces roridus]
MLFLNICTAWTNISVSIPALWDTIEIMFPRHKSFDKVLDKWLQRARGRPLHISLEGAVDADVAACIWQYSTSLRRLDISFEALPKYDKPHDLLGGNMPQAPLPCLQTLYIYGIFDVFCSWDPVLELLGLSPNLVDLSLRNTSFSDGDYVDKDLVLPNLRELEYTGSSLDGGTLSWLSARISKLSSFRQPF